MKTFFLAITLLIMALSLQAQRKVDVHRKIEFAKARYELMLKANTDLTRFPQSVKKEGVLDTRTSDWWCSGFFGGSLWYLYEYTKDDKWKAVADKWTMPVEKEKYNKTTHDLGFMLYCPFGNGYRLTGNKKYLNQAINIAKFIANHPNLPSDKIPYWDFNAPNIPDEEREASAAAITASALLELYTYTNDRTHLKLAEDMLRSLSGKVYTANLGENNNFLLKHSVGSKPYKSEVDKIKI